ncbi:hypothetical protein B0T09DRAFT_132628 [Sordaria sp. MPI-SDFR-AT-0083]|nr:hypothetical protein B0T09DRAFT_132628 [Sordaria sp. MPI-SDFR-AT-0083]
MRRRSKRPKASPILFSLAGSPFWLIKLIACPVACLLQRSPWECFKVPAICSLEEASSTGACLASHQSPSKQTSLPSQVHEWCGREGIEIRIGFRFWTDHCPVIDQSQWIEAVPGSSPENGNPLFLRRLILNIKTSNPDHPKDPWSQPAD